MSISFSALCRNFSATCASGSGSRHEGLVFMASLSSCWEVSRPRLPFIELVEVLEVAQQVGEAHLASASLHCGVCGVAVGDDY